MKKLMVVLAILMIASVAVAQPMSATQQPKGTIATNLIKANGTSVTNAPAQQQTYTIPIIQSLPLADGSGNTASVIVATPNLTLSQITQGIAQIQQKIANETKQLASDNQTLTNLQAEQTQINNLNAQPVQATPPVNQ